MSEALLFFYIADWEKGSRKDFSLREICLSSYAAPWVSSKKCVQASDPEDTALPAPTVEYELQPHVHWVE